MEQDDAQNLAGNTTDQTSQTFHYCTMKYLHFDHLLPSFTRKLEIVVYFSRIKNIKIFIF